MDNFFKDVFLKEIDRQCDFALRAYQEIVRALDESNIDMLWYSVQSFLVACGNISKLLWPNPNDETIKNRGSDLRKAIYANENSPLKNRRLRNHFEHFDNRIEKWITNSISHDFIDSNIGSIETDHNTQVNCLRNINPDNMSLTFQGEIYKLEPIFNEVKRIKLQLYADSVGIVVG